MRRQAGALVGAVTACLLLGSCVTDARAVEFTAPEDYGTVEQLVADADVVALVQADGAHVDTVERVPYTRTEVRLRKVLLGAAAGDATMTVTQVGSLSQPPGSGLPDVLRKGQEYVVVLHRTGPGSSRSWAPASGAPTRSAPA
nr:hypothetical protein GCM10025730_04150 [Promicromonospora thailandica]